MFWRLFSPLSVLFVVIVGLVLISNKHFNLEEPFYQAYFEMFWNTTSEKGGRVGGGVK